MKKLLFLVLFGLSLSNVFAQDTAKSKNDAHLSALYINDLSGDNGNTISGGSIILDIKNISILAILEQKTVQESSSSTKQGIYNLGIGRKISQFGTFKTSAYVCVGVYNTKINTGFAMYNKNDYKPNIGFGLIGQDKFMTYLIGIQSNYKGVGLIVGLGLNSNLFK